MPQAPRVGAHKSCPRKPSLKCCLHVCSIHHWSQVWDRRNREGAGQLLLDCDMLATCLHAGETSLSQLPP